jgi:hypothetical protein
MSDFDVTQDDVVQAALNRLELCKQRVIAFQFSMETLHSHHHQTPALKSAETVIWAALMRDELDAYRNLFMWANIFQGEALERAKAEAYKRFLSERDGIMYMLSYDGIPPGSYACGMEKAFRNLIEETKERDDRET